MTTQKTFKRRVRARAQKTGESYTAARARLLAKATPPSAPAVDEEAVARTGLRDEAVRRGSGRSIAEWLAVLDAWGAQERTHRDIARWLREEQGVDGWWAQSVTVGYERARGMRAKYETTSGFTAGASRTIAASADRVLEAFTDPALRERWLPKAPMRLRGDARPGKGARFDWDDPPSRVVLGLDPKGEGRTQLGVIHEKLPDSAAVERLRPMWRERLLALKAMLEA